jgi:hypothetical protein
VLLTAGLIALCCRGAGERDVAGMWAEPVGSDSVRAYVEMRERGYAALEPVPLKLVAVNKTGRTLCLTFPTAQRFDFIIGKDEEPVWSWSEGRAFEESPLRVALAPGDSLVYEYVWKGRLKDGSLPRLGRYRLKGALMTAPPVETGERQFGIVD